MMPRLQTRTSGIAPWSCSILLLASATPWWEYSKGTGKYAETNICEKWIAKWTCTSRVAGVINLELQTLRGLVGMLQRGGGDTTKQVETGIDSKIDEPINALLCQALVPKEAIPNATCPWQEDCSVHVG
ncbi:unnamed protein product [Prorocentrum cordatum]|uniref:Uncharacterized protein n=1 Tax=Prorocentrum cordatum TaxID=2364126 RepID=A0ABN9TSB5_9DINO|nr:unnamed protein product [Polarella glacialis]